MEKAEDDAALKVLLELAESAPTILGPHLGNISQEAIKMIGDKDQEDSWRQRALEVMVKLCETAPAMVRKEVPMVGLTLTLLVLDMMCEIEDDFEWAMKDEAAIIDGHHRHQNNNVVAKSALDVMCCGLGGKKFVDLIVGSVSVMLQSEDWRRRHAALMAVSSASVWCYKQMEQILDQVVPAVLNHLADPHPRVRYAACNAVKQMFMYFPMKKFHDKVVPGLFPVLEDNANPRVQAHAAAALNEFIKDCPKPILSLYLEPLINKLEVILTAKLKELNQHGRKHVLEEVVTTIGSIADTVENKFAPYYDRFMPCLKKIIANATTADLMMLRGKTIECVSHIGLAVGEERILADASEVMELLLTEGEQLASDDPPTSFLISAWCRICKIMGKNFAQYLPVVMGPVMRTAAMKPAMALDWHFLLGQQRNFANKTAGLKGKASACDMLVCCARELKGEFAEYAENVVKLMVPMLKFYLHNGVRTAAAESLPYLLECLLVRGQQHIEGMWAYILPELLEAIDTEPQHELEFQLLNSLAKCIELLGNGCLTDETMAAVLYILNKFLTELYERATERRQKRADDDYDEVVEKQLAHEDYEDACWLSNITNVLGALLSTYREGFFPHLDSLLPNLAALTHPDRPYSHRQWAIYIFNDVIEFGGPACVEYRDIFLEPMLNGLCAPEAEVREAAAYSCGVLAQFGGPQFADACARAVPRLAAIADEPDARSFLKVDATEDAVYAVTEIIKYNHSKINRDEIISHWLTWLPVDGHSSTAPHVCSLLCELITEAFLRGAAVSDTVVVSQIGALVRQIQSNTELINSCLMQLNNEQEEALQQALSQVA